MAETNNEISIKPEATFAKLAAILEAAYDLGILLRRPVGVEEAALYFARMREAEFWNIKAQNDHEEQMKEVGIYLYGENTRLKTDIGQLRAEREWTAKYAEAFRRYRESPGRNGFVFIAKHIVNNYGLHMRPSHEVSEAVNNFFCNVFVNHERVQDLLLRDFILSLTPDEQAFIQELMPDSDIVNLSALAAIRIARAKDPGVDQLRKDRELKLMGSITMKYRDYHQGEIPENVTEMRDYDLVIKDEFGTKRPYMELSFRKHKGGGTVLQDLISLVATPGNILRFVFYGQDKDAACSKILYILGKRYDGRSDQ